METVTDNAGTEERLAKLEAEVARVSEQAHDLFKVCVAIYSRGREDERAYQSTGRNNAPEALRHLHSVDGGGR